MSPRRTSSPTKPRRYHPLPKKNLVCFLCKRPTSFTTSSDLDAHLHRDHPDWFQTALRNLYIKMHPELSQL